MKEPKAILITTSSFDLDSAGLLADLKARGFSIIPNPFGRKLTEAEVTELLERYQPVAMIAGVEPLNRSVLTAAKHLRVISRCGIGMDSVDGEAARDLGIAVTNTPDAPTIPVAELTMGLILGLLRRIHLSDAGIRRGVWERPMGTLLHGKTAGVIGCGRIGTCTARLLNAFGCRVLGYDVIPRNSQWYENADLPEVLGDSDIVLLHLTYSDQTHHFLNRERIALMKEGAVLVNTARGGLVDEGALEDALRSGHLGGAALDCFEEEPYHGPLRDLDNVVLCAHIGSYAREARRLMELQAAENMMGKLKEIGVIA